MNLIITNKHDCAVSLQSLWMNGVLNLILPICSITMELMHDFYHKHKASLNKSQFYLQL